MKRYIAQTMVLSLLAAGLAVLPVAARAQGANTNAPPKQTMTPKGHAIPFHGKVTAVDTKAMTLTVGNRTFQLTSDTKISKDGQPATLSDVMVGEPVRGTYQKADAGKLDALSVQLGAKQRTPNSNGK